MGELQIDALGFRALRQRYDGMSSSVLRRFLVELGEAGLVHQTGESPYALTTPGREAFGALRPLVSQADVLPVAGQ
ncbi:hypothetical protein SAMN05421854_121112 [Amycolatopsis rubida]|uniref:Transcriptional regulator n=1 Tax=Amycolatopsis rubida TaxID=112413 RepID=A0A1I6AXV7_9PSEU|nr:hypothetical protein SAMN05421854_121112 [Amycolatopsis rubida]